MLLQNKEYSSYYETNIVRQELYKHIYINFKLVSLQSRYSFPHTRFSIFFIIFSILKIETKFMNKTLSKFISISYHPLIIIICKKNPEYINNKKEIANSERKKMLKVYDRMKLFKIILSCCKFKCFSWVNSVNVFTPIQ